VEGYTDVSRRAALVEAAESALRRMARDIHGALPNSVRVNDPGTGASFALELLPILDGAKYSQDGNAFQKLVFNVADAEFDLKGCFRNPASLNAPGRRLVVNNRGTGAGNVYSDAQLTSGPSVITYAATTITITNVNPLGTLCPDGLDATHHITLGTAQQFRSASPNQRLYVITTPVSYLCDTDAGTLTRYYNYPILSTQVTTAAGFAPIASNALVTDRVNNCRALTATTDVRNRGLVTLTLGLSAAGETINLVHQVQLDNSR
jgi:MSHA biogenesis protein MshO